MVKRIFSTSTTHDQSNFLRGQMYLAQIIERMPEHINAVIKQKQEAKDNQA